MAAWWSKILTYQMVFTKVLRLDKGNVTFSLAFMETNCYSVMSFRLQIPVSFFFRRKLNCVLILVIHKNDVAVRTTSDIWCNTCIIFNMDMFYSRLKVWWHDTIYGKFPGHRPSYWYSIAVNECFFFCDPLQLRFLHIEPQVLIEL